MADVVQNDDVEFGITQVVLHEVAGPQRKLALDAELRHDLLRMRKLIRREMQSTAAVGLRLVPKTGFTIRRSAPEGNAQVRFRLSIDATNGQNMTNGNGDRSSEREERQVPDPRARNVTVVGAGPNGLSAAVALAYAGYQVEVREASDQIGGGTRTEELTLPGFRHDVCSSVHPMGACSPFFRLLPLKEFGLEWIDPPVLMAHPFDDGSAAVLMHSTLETADSLPRTDANAYRRLMDPFVRYWDAVIGEALAPPLHIPRHPLLMARLGFVGLPAAATVARRFFSSDRARAFFLGIAAHTLLPMTKAPSAAFGIILALAGHAAGWPVARGGSQSIANALAGLLRHHGGAIQTHSPVRSLGSLRGQSAIVLDLTPRQVLAISGDRLPSRYRAALEAYRYGPGVFKIDWALAEPIPWRAAECRRAGTIHLGATSTDIVRSAQAAWEGRPDDRPYVILTQPSLFDSSRAPKDRHTAWAYCHVPHGSAEERTSAIEAQIERFAPGFRDVVLARHTLNTRQLEAHNENLVGGDINGGVQDLWQFVRRPALRIDPYATPLQGVFLCSASTPPGGAVHGMCGYNAAQSVIRRFTSKSSSPTYA